MEGKYCPILLSGCFANSKNEEMQKHVVAKCIGEDCALWVKEYDKPHGGKSYKVPGGCSLLRISSEMGSFGGMEEELRG